MPCLPSIIKVDGDFVFPRHDHGDPYTPVNVPIQGCGLQNIDPAGGSITIPIRTWGIPDSNFNWSYTGWWIARDYTVRYTGRDDTHILGVTKYPSKGKINNLSEIDTGYYNPNAYWVPPAPGDPPPPGGDPAAVPGQDPTTTDPPVHNVYVNRPYHYADMLIYDLMGVNRTGTDLAEDPDNPGVFLDPYDVANNVLSFIYNEDENGVFSEDTNLANMDWEPDGDNCRNQQVALMSANKEGARGIRQIARNRRARKEVGVYSGWESVGGSNVQDVSEDTVAGYASNEVEKYGRPPNFCKLYLLLEPSTGTPVYGEAGWQPQPLRDFGLGDRVLARGRKGYMDSGALVVRIMQIKIGQADPNNNVLVEIDCVPHMSDLSEIEVV